MLYQTPAGLFERCKGAAPSGKAGRSASSFNSSKSFAYPTILAKNPRHTILQLSRWRCRPGRPVAPRIDISRLHTRTDQRLTVHAARRRPAAQGGRSFEQRHEAAERTRLREEIVARREKCGGVKTSEQKLSLPILTVT